MRVVALAFALSLIAAAPAAAWTADDPPAWIPEGIYLVTETYVGDVVTSNGSLTTYTTATVTYTPGSYARVLETVGTAQDSLYDGAAFNGRAALADGRAVAGTYYENFALTGEGFVPVSIVFFQDDAEIAAAMQPLAPAAAPSPAPPPVSGSPSAEVPPAGEPPMSSGPSSETPPPPFREPVVRAGIAPFPQGDLLASIEVLRGRLTRLWPRATVDGVPAEVVSWSISGELTAVGPLSGGYGEPIAVRWDRLSVAGTTWPMHVVMQVDVPGYGLRGIDAVIAVGVRSPALVR